jgi:AraC-like DNA-binding protein
MQSFKHDFTNRQYMITPDYEYFHYKDRTVTEVEYHNHDFYEIYFFLSGKVTYVIEGKSYRLTPGDIVLLSNRELHRPSIEHGSIYERIVLWVNPEYLLSKSIKNTNLHMCFESHSGKRQNLLRTDPALLSYIHNILDKFEGACNSISFGANLLKEIYMLELLTYVNKAFIDSYDEESLVDIEYNEKIDAVLYFINNNLSSNLTLDSISANFYISKYHLLREFKKYTGFTIHSYIRQKRLIEAKVLLRNGLKVAEVCARTGFGDYANFIRAFKNAYGVSPGKYLKSL